jgi:hypothetical protein
MLLPSRKTPTKKPFNDHLHKAHAKNTSPIFDSRFSGIDPVPRADLPFSTWSRPLCSAPRLARSLNFLPSRKKLPRFILSVPLKEYLCMEYVPRIFGYNSILRIYLRVPSDHNNLSRTSTRFVRGRRPNGRTDERASARGSALTLTLTPSFTHVLHVTR